MHGPIYSVSVRFEQASLFLSAAKQKAATLYLMCGESKKRE